MVLILHYLLVLLLFCSLGLYVSNIFAVQFLNVVVGEMLTHVLTDNFLAILTNLCFCLLHFAHNYGVSCWLEHETVDGGRSTLSPFDFDKPFRTFLGLITTTLQRPTNWHREQFTHGFVMHYCKLANCQLSYINFLDFLLAAIFI